LQGTYPKPNGFIDLLTTQIVRVGDSRTRMLPFEVLMQAFVLSLLDASNPTRDVLPRLDRACGNALAAHMDDAFMASHPGVDDDGVALARAPPRGIWLLLKRLDVSDSAKHRALLSCARAGDLPRVAALITAPHNPAHADADVFGVHSYALVCAAENGHLAVVRALLDAPLQQHPAHADADDGEVLRRAALNGHLEVVRALLDAPLHAAHADAQESNALMYAAKNGHLAVVRALLDAPQHASHADAQESNALMYAAGNGHPEVVRALLDAPTHPAHADAADLIMLF
jgi:tRNA-binding EMAP/Myf-like protein